MSAAPRSVVSPELNATPENKFSFGLWTIGNRGRDPFGEAVRPKIEITDMLKGLADLGVYGVSFHDDDLMTFGAPESQRRAELDLASARPGTDPTALAAAERELLALQASDWAFMESGDRTGDYGARRFAEHVAAFECAFSQLRR